MGQRRLLNFEQNLRRMGIAQEKLTTFNSDLDLLKKIATDGYDIENKSQTAQWKHSEELRPKKARHARLNEKV